MNKFILFLAVAALIQVACAFDEDDDAGAISERDTDQIIADETINEGTDEAEDGEGIHRSKRATTDVTTEMLRLHNADRRRHHVGALRRNNDLASRARQCAQRNANRGSLKHDCPQAQGYGENLASGSGMFSSPASAYKRWYNEIRNYNFRSGGFSLGTGHFTQAVWKGTRELGCGMARGSSGTFISCLYSPSGNYAGRFKSNVLRV